MINFEWDLLNMLSQFVMVSLGLAVILVVIFYSDRSIFKRPEFWQLLVVANLLALAPLTISVLPEDNFLMPSSWLNPMSVESSKVVEEKSVLSERFSIVAIFLWLIYLGGTLYCFFGFTKKIVSLKQLISKAKPYEIDSELGCKLSKTIKSKNISILQSDTAISPFAFGLIKPCVVVPGYINNLPPKQRRLIIEHELTHIRYKDPQVILFIQFINCLFWFNPIFWVYLTKMTQAMELRVDRQIIRKVSPNEYAETLISVFKSARIALPHRILVGSVQSHQHQLVKHRILEIMSNPSQLNRKQIKALVCWSFAIICWPIYMMSVQAEPVSEKPWVYPLETNTKKVNSYFKAVHAIRNHKPHLGVDLNAKLGTKIIAPINGRVLVADDTTMNPNYGNVVVLQHANGVRSFYAHLSKITVAVGDTVSTGESIGLVGNTGKSTGPHLHMEVLIDNTHLDPLNFIDMSE
ncbi:peptidoglycan DD-metalloendopeptidase family protein [Aliikangiella marina]|uniref:Peptidoglycan DD-metalloendopeptidase family protein n=1 Tax=Aliikangiella marina TaxID=1712262 RepID=A0A545T1L9_9GAMM|nr:M23/M56 family metallopeptidase [Aliikangiella marina]TQV71104.1 peptidoglycan DD-metalloendopeptidase family protein [Aliikangiella marina]